ASSTYLGVTDRTADPEHAIRIQDNLGTNQARVNDLTFVSYSTSAAANQLLTVNRSSSTTTQLYTNGSSDGSGTATSISIPDIDLYLLAQNF
ncbi:MAG TPA: hypothetical protein DEB67_08055, partial [Oceanicaulis sp.]|nr:hypothetical protein [Oceanicaulis sp.]